MTMKTVYLAGPIAGCTDSEANDWRKHVSHKLKNWHIMGISPLRCEPLHGHRYATPIDMDGLKTEQADPRFGTARAIASKNMFDVMNCDMTLCYFPRAVCEQRPSYGTVCELAWAKMYGKPAILVTDDPYLGNHPVIGACAGWILSTLDEGVDVITGILGDYARAGW